MHTPGRPIAPSTRRLIPAVITTRESPASVGLFFYDRSIAFWHYVRMPDEHYLALRRADQARTDFAAIESDLEFIMGQLARLPTRKEQATTTLTIILTTALLTTLSILWFTGARATHAHAREALPQPKRATATGGRRGSPQAGRSSATARYGYPYR